MSWPGLGVCTYCNKRCADLKMCACKNALYCSEGCKSLASLIHDDHCKVFRTQNGAAFTEMMKLYHSGMYFPAYSGWMDYYLLKTFAVAYAFPVRPAHPKLCKCRTPTEKWWIVNYHANKCARRACSKPLPPYIPRIPVVAYIDCDKHKVPALWIELRYCTVECYAADVAREHVMITYCADPPAEFREHGVAFVDRDKEVINKN